MVTLMTASNNEITLTQTAYGLFTVTSPWSKDTFNNLYQAVNHFINMSELDSFCEVF